MSFRPEHRDHGAKSSTARIRRARRKSALQRAWLGGVEPLEGRLLMAYSAVRPNANNATMTGDSAADSLTIIEEGGLLKHLGVTGLDLGFADDFDFDTTVAGSQRLDAALFTVLNIDIGQGIGESVRVGNAASPASNIPSVISLTVPAGNTDDFAMVDDSGNSAATTYDLGGSTISASGGLLVTFNGQPWTDGVDLFTGDGGDTANVNSTFTKGVLDVFLEGGNDRAVFADGATVTGLIDGGPQINELDASAYTTPVNVDLGTGATNLAAGGAFNFEQARAGSGGSSLTAALGTAATLVGGSGVDVINGSDQDDLLDGNGDNDVINGNGGNDTANGGSGSDVVGGGPGDDLLNGDDGDDALIGDTGADTMNGGNDNDVMIWNPGDGSDVMNGDAGDDVAQLNGGGGAEDFRISANGPRFIFERLNPAPFNLNVGTVESLDLNGNDGADRLFLNFDGGYPIPFGPDSFTAGPGGAFFRGGVDFDGGTGADLLVLDGALPGGASIVDEVYTAFGPGRGEIFVDGRIVNFDNLEPVVDVVSAINYTFNAPLTTTGTILVADAPAPIPVGPTIGILNDSGPDEFEEAFIANKLNVTVNGGGGPGFLDGSDIRVNFTGAGTGIQNLNVNGTDAADLLALEQTGVPTQVSLFGDNDRATVILAGIPVGSAATLDGGSGFDVLDVNFSGEGIASASFDPVTGFVTLVSTGGRTLVFRNFEQINLTNVAPSPFNLPNIIVPVPLTDIAFVEGSERVDAVVARFTDFSPGARAADFGATIDWGDGTTSAGEVRATADPFLFEILGTHQYETPGTYPIGVRVRDEGSVGPLFIPGLPPGVVITVDENPVVVPPFGDPPVDTANAVVSDAALIDAGVTLFTEEGAPLVDVLVGSFTDLDPNSDPAEFLAVIDWGDGTSSLGTILPDPRGLAGATYRVLGTHPGSGYDTEGFYEIRVTVTDAFGTTLVIGSDAVVSNTITVTAVPEAFTATEGTPVVDIPVARFFDPGPPEPVTDFVATIDWGDGTPPTLGRIIVSNIIPVGPGAVITEYTVLGTHAYQADGTYTGQVLIHEQTDPLVAGGDAQTSFVATVAPLAITCDTITVPAGTPLGNVLLATVSSVGGPEPDAGLYRALIDFGDGESIDVPVDQVGAFFEVRLSGHVFSAPGPRELRITIFTADGVNVVSGACPVTVEPVVINTTPVTAVAGTPLGQLVLATLTSAGGALDPTAYSALVDFGDGTQVQGLLVPDGLGGLQVIVTDKTYAQEGLNFATITVRDAAGVVVAQDSVAILVEGVDAACDPVTLVAGTPSGRRTLAVLSSAGGAVDATGYSVTVALSGGELSGAFLEQAGATVLVRVDGLRVDQPGPVDATITVRGAGGAVVGIATCPITVAPVTLTPTTPPPTVIEDTPSGVLTLATFSTTGPGGLDAGAYTVTVVLSTGEAVPAELVQVAPGLAEVRVRGITLPEGPASATITVRAAGGTVVATAVTPITVVTVTLDCVSITATAGTPLGTTTLATLSSTGGALNLTGYTATVSLSTGEVVSAFLVQEGGSVAVRVNGLSIARAGITEGVVTVRAADGTVVAQGVCPITVQPVTIIGNSITVPAGTPQGTLTLATISSSGGPALDASAYSVTVVLSDGQAVPAVLQQAGAGINVLVSGLTLSRAGNVTATIILRAADGTVVNTGVAQITVAPVTITCTPITATVGTALGGLVLARLSSTGGPLDPTAYQAIIDFGDGTQAIGIIRLEGGVLTVSASDRVFSRPGTFQATVTVRANDGTIVAQGVCPIVVVPVTIVCDPVTVTAGTPSQTVTLATINSLGGPVLDPNLYSVSVVLSTGQTVAAYLEQVGNALLVRVSGLNLQTPGIANAIITLRGANGVVVATQVCEIRVQPIILNCQPVTVAQGTPSGTITLATINTAGGPNLDPSRLSAVVTFSTGGSAIAEIVGSGPTLRVVLSGLVFQQAGTVQATITIRSAEGVIVAQSVCPITVTAVVITCLPFKATEDVPFSDAPLALLTTPGGPEPNPADYTVTIDYGDGTAPAAGRLVSQGSGILRILGSHTYRESGTFQARITVSTPGRPVIVTEVCPIVVGDVAIDLSGRLAPQSDTGISNSDNITFDNTPTFIGRSEPGSNVRVTATPAGGGAAIFLGSTTTDPSGAWELTSAANLPDGVYVVRADAVDRNGVTEASTVIVPQLVVDTVGMRITGASIVRQNGRLGLQFTDNLSGVATRTVVDSANYQFTKGHAGPGKFQITSASASAAGNPLTQSVQFLVNGGRSIRGGRFLAVAYAAELIDVAGNPLDGEFYGSTPTGNGLVGGDFLATIDAFHNKVLPARPLDGFSPPPSGAISPGELKRFNQRSGLFKGQTFGRLGSQQVRARGGAENVRARRSIVVSNRGKIAKAPKTTVTPHDLAIEQLQGRAKG